MAPSEEATPSAPEPQNEAADDATDENEAADDAADDAADEVADEPPSAEPTQTVRFGLDGLAYEIDLSDENAAELRDALRRYTDAGRRVARQTAKPTPKPTTTTPTTTTPTTTTPTSRGHGSANHHDIPAIREWARTHGHPISDRGPIPAKVRQAYDARRRRGA